MSENLDIKNENKNKFTLFLKDNLKKNNNCNNYNDNYFLFFYFLKII